MALSNNMHFGMLVDLSACIGCNACVVACKMENNVPLTKFNTWIESWDAGAYPDVSRANVPHLCNHCVDAPCARVCPTGATRITPEGAVVLDESRCIGCKYCMAACPFQVRYQDPSTHAVEKCTFCYHRTSSGLLPACVSVCPTHARVFGDTNDPDSTISKRMANDVTESINGEIGLDVSVHYIGLSDTRKKPVASGVCHAGVVVKHLEDVSA